ncbi:MAG: NUDIX hydrolase [Oscillospiraceae bacterium]|nr:NUDIX hydrolase [Oscillospiraceae bacterium]
MQENNGRAQALVTRGNQVLMVQHCMGDDAHYCLPGGGIECGETPEQAALRELREECNVTGTIIRKSSEWADPYHTGTNYTYHIDIGDQIPTLGFDPELQTQILTQVRWLTLAEMTETDRAFVWSARLMSIPQFAQEMGVQPYD